MMAVAQCQPDSLSPSFDVVQSNFPNPEYESFFTAFSGLWLEPIESAVGFTAELSQPVELFPGSRMIFDTVISNFGGFYSSDDGVFRCPDNGIYSFVVSTHVPEQFTEYH